MFLPSQPLIIKELTEISHSLNEDFNTFERLNRCSGGQGLAMNKISIHHARINQLINLLKVQLEPTIEIKTKCNAGSAELF